VLAAKIIRAVVSLESRKAPDAVAVEEGQGHIGRVYVRRQYLRSVFV